MRNIVILSAILIVLLAAGFFFFNGNGPVKQSTVANPTQVPSTTPVPDGDDSKVVLGVFSGTIPCADCEGIKMTLTLYQDPKTLGASGYTLDSEYLGRENSNFNEQGDWDYLRGNSEDPNATIYGLNLDKPKTEQQYFLKVGDDKVTMLDPKMNPIKSNLNYTLTKVAAD